MIKKEVLPNGLRIVTENVPHVQSASLGIWIATGARDESLEHRGICHFIEHMLFKGTKNRTAGQIADEFDFLGGQLNAFTEKEYTCYYCKVLSEHIPQAVEILADMLLNSLFRPEDIELEKNVVLEEIKRYEDTPEDLVHDVLTLAAWNSHPLGNRILGEWESISSLTRDTIVAFMEEKYTPGNIVIAAAGNVDHQSLVDQISSLFGHLQGSVSEPNYQAPEFSGSSVCTNRPTEQVHFCVGTPGFSQLDSDRYTLAVIDAALGGSMSSRLFQEIREKRGLAYTIGSYSASFREGGLFVVYGGTSMENVRKVLELIKEEFDKVAKHNLTADELARAKNQIRGGLVLSQENMSNRMIRIAKSELYFGRPMPLEEVISHVLQVTHDDVAHVAWRIFESSPIAIATVGPLEEEVVVN
jgi:predicted Zn-dependent peptidase